MRSSLHLVTSYAKSAKFLLVLCVRFTRSVFARNFASTTVAAAIVLSNAISLGVQTGQTGHMYICVALYDSMPF